VVRCFRGEARFSTYLVVVVHRFFVDYAKERGIWRPSAAVGRRSSGQPGSPRRGRRG
jgi:hypothetical protein